MDKLEKSIKDISNNYYSYLINLQNVNGVGYGYKYINDKNTFEPCIHVLVEDKIDKKYISKNNLIPKSYMGIKTDVITIGKIELTEELNNPHFKTRPLKAGAGIGALNKKTRGTLCCIVKKKIEIFPKVYVYSYYLLSNNHVLANNGDLAKGEPVIQPTRETGVKRKVNEVATLDTFIFMKKYDSNSSYLGFENKVDCAIAEITDKSLISDKVLGLNKITGVTEAEIGMTVNKVGSTTGVQQGTVKTLHETCVYGKGKNTFIYLEQLGIDIKSAPGDSGAPILTLDNELVGMHMGKGTLLSATVSNNINNVFSELDVELYLEKKV